jgi:hypothetical protein
MANGTEGLVNMSNGQELQVRCGEHLHVMGGADFTRS